MKKRLVILCVSNRLLPFPLCSLFCEVSHSLHCVTFNNTLVLDLKEYNVILGCDWPYKQSPFALNLKTKEFLITLEDVFCYPPNENVLVGRGRKKIALLSCPCRVWVCSCAQNVITWRSMPREKGSLVHYGHVPWTSELITQSRAHGAASNSSARFGKRNGCRLMEGKARLPNLQQVMDTIQTTA